MITQLPHLAQNGNYFRLVPERKSLISNEGLFADAMSCQPTLLKSRLDSDHDAGLTGVRHVSAAHHGSTRRQETVAQRGELDAQGQLAARSLADRLVGVERQPGLFDDDLRGVKLERGRRCGARIYVNSQGSSAEVGLENAPDPDGMVCQVVHFC
ncbi:MAG: hypothetical protein EXS09_05300 [Gemmataceae bacterium]|nr:hypothetical protein [Gemmataceae bacterium]